MTTKLDRYMYLLLALAGLTLFHQSWTYGVWFEIGDLHHETFALMLVTAAVAIYFTRQYMRKISRWR